MNLPIKILLMLVIFCQFNHTFGDVQNLERNKIASENQNELLRNRRAFFFKKKKPGTFGTILGLIFDQFRDTKATINKVTTTINAQFVDENEVKPKKEKQLEGNATTTEAPYKLTRSELYRIIRRNVKGLQRLFKIELQDALSQPKTTHKDLRGVY